MITNNPYVEERKIFGYAIAQNSSRLAEMFANVGGNTISSVVATSIMQSVIGPLEDPEHSYSLLKAGIRDTRGFYNCVLNPNFTNDQRRTIARHPKTIKRLIELAMHSDADVKYKAGVELYSDGNYVMSDDNEYITVVHLPMLRPETGCPFAGNNKYERVDPLFIKFAQWTTNLLFTHYELHSAVQPDNSLTFVS